MGDPKYTRKKYSNPKKRWDKKRIEDEKNLVEFYGLKNKREIRKIEAMLRKKRTTAKKLLAAGADARTKGERILIESLKKLGILKGDAHIDDVLGLGLQEFLERRLETIVWRKGLAKTIKQARQFIVHGHIAIGDRKVTVPSYLVSPHEESKIKYFGTPMVIDIQKVEKKSLKKKFEEARGEQKEGDIVEGLPEEGAKKRKAKAEKMAKEKKVIAEEPAAEGEETEFAEGTNEEETETEDKGVNNSE